MKLFDKKARLTIKHASFALISLLIFIASANLEAAEQRATLELKPEQCVALHHGQKCYSDIDLTFTASEKGNYCLYSSQSLAKPIKCWDNQSTGQYTNEVVTVKNVIFTLRHRGMKVVLATTELKMSWVYRKNSRAKSAWRVF